MQYRLQGTLAVNYWKSVSQLAKDGRYDHPDRNATDQNFPDRKWGWANLNFVVFGLALDTPTETVFDWFTHLGLRRPSAKEGLTFGVKYPNFQCLYPVMVLCDPWKAGRGYNAIIGLTSDPNKRRELYLPGLAHQFHSSWSFLGISTAK